MWQAASANMRLYTARKRDILRIFPAKAVLTKKKKKKKTISEKRLIAYTTHRLPNFLKIHTVRLKTVK